MAAPQWKDEDVVKHGQVAAQITSRVGDRGDKLYSVLLGRMGREGDRVFPHMRPRDLEDVPELIEQVKNWFNENQERGFQRRPEPNFNSHDYHEQQSFAPDRTDRKNGRRDRGRGRRENSRKDW